jgi:hypothetical protein
MSNQIATRDPVPLFTHTQRRALRVLRAYYRQHCDLFSAAELAHLRFVRWLVQTGRLEP